MGSSTGSVLSVLHLKIASGNLEDCKEGESTIMGNAPEMEK